MSSALVGYTGFVGSNLYAKGQFDALYNSKNIAEGYGTKPDICVYAGVRAEKYLANTDPERDMEQILRAERNIERINPHRLVLISTIDVFKSPKNVYEDSVIDTEGLHPYGYDRYCLEQWVRENYPDALIVRLPGLFGRNIKKNFIYDYMNVIPSMLKKDRFEELSSADPEIAPYYSLQDNGFYKAVVPDDKKDELKERFKKLHFTALNFTDSRSSYQFYDLGRLWDDIQTAAKAGITMWHPAVEPVTAGELYQYLTGEAFVNELNGMPADYDYRTRYDDLFGGHSGYICTKQQVMSAIRTFTEGER